MKKIIFIVWICFFQFSCEDVIEVDLNTVDPKLVIEASINWTKGTSGNEQMVKLSLTAPYFDSEIPPATGAQVQIISATNTVYQFIEDGATGIYKNNTFKPVINRNYELLITYKDEQYRGQEIFQSVASINRVDQNNEGGFSGEDIELKAFYSDLADEKNFYFFEFLSHIPAIPSLSIYEDKFNNGNENFGFYSEENLSSGDIVIIKNYGISERFYNYMYILLQQNSDSGGGPFETQPAIVRGNCVNETNPENFPLGYFRLSEVSEVVYTVQ
ncbi:DUF4249 domain-containing protein [Gelidibacter salicanalis]|uniref:DUF4249 domain-containing protein n=1 Tax=Gelidibacter salicanalis TaxID=291193 RepID=A0A5C7AM41_9FLAO|nr:DUF4249 domain-containing protein [Gelidibacter salicanalis]TXE07635.1 DUF4249 domain-containing protein [Gelidibacter salicanalis]